MKRASNVLCLGKAGSGEHGGRSFRTDSRRRVNRQVKEKARLTDMISFLLEPTIGKYSNCCSYNFIRGVSDRASRSLPERRWRGLPLSTGKNDGHPRKDPANAFSYE